MSLSVEKLLACPQCQADLPAPPSDPQGTICCPGCHRHYPVTRGIPRFMEADRYVRSFSFQWTRHRMTQLDDAGSSESEETFRAKTGFGPEDVRGRLVLDVGCGMGRFADVVSRWGGNVVACDLSYAVEAAHQNLGRRDNVAILQADVFRMPFREASFDIIYSIGVLHHTPDCEKAFRRLPRLLKPGGRIAIWVYGPPQGWHRRADFYRRFTTRMPPRALYALCHVAVPLYYLFKLPPLDRVLWPLLPISLHPRAEWRVLDTFDWYAPRYQSKHTYPEAFRWFVSEGLTDIELLDVAVAVRGRRPVR
jgi:SAM-dependent methyltransferase